MASSRLCQSLAGRWLAHLAQAALAQIFVEDDGLGDLTHGLAALTAFALHGFVGGFFIEAEIALQNALRALDVLARFKAGPRVAGSRFQGGRAPVPHPQGAR